MTRTSPTGYSVRYIVYIDARLVLCDNRKVGDPIFSEYIIYKAISSTRPRGVVPLYNSIHPTYNNRRRHTGTHIRIIISMPIDTLST